MKLVFAILVLSLLTGESVFADQREDNFRRASEAYYKNRWDEALSLYQALLKEFPTNAHLYFNLGNVYFRKGEMGRALQHYAKALNLKPREPDIRANLKFVQKKTGVELPVPFSTTLKKNLFFWNSYFTLHELVLSLLMVAAVFWSSLTLRLYIKRPLLKGGVWGFGILLALMLVSTGIKYDETLARRWGILIKPEVAVRPAYLKSVEPFVKLPDGAKVEILGDQEFKNEEKWIQIRLPNGTRGWILEEEIGVI